MRGQRAVIAIASAAMLIAAIPGAGLSAAAGDRLWAGEPTEVVHTTRAGGTALWTGSVSLASTSPQPCSDGKYNLLGPRWKSTLNWSYRASTTPSGLSASSAAKVIKRGFGNIVKARNDCGRPDRVSATATYLGTTTRKIGVTSDARCGAADGRNVVGFGALPAGVLGVTCIRSSGTRIVEIDVRFNSQMRWTLSLSGCFNRWMLEAVATHEAGHAFGLDHVSEAKHGRLTMSTYIDGMCQNNESRLGLGDMRGLEALY